MGENKATIDAFRDPETGRYLLLDPTSRDCECLGAGMALASLEDTLFLQHAPIGCQFNKAIRHAAQGTLPMWACSLLTEKETVFGGEERLAQSLEKANDVYRPAAIAVVSACMPELIGDDIENVTRRMESRLGVPIFPVRLAGFRGDHHTGYRKAVPAALDRFLPPPQTAMAQKESVTPAGENMFQKDSGAFAGKMLPRSVTLTGFSPLEHKAGADLAELKRILEWLGLPVHCTLTGASGR